MDEICKFPEGCVVAAKMNFPSSFIQDEFLRRCYFMVGSNPKKNVLILYPVSIETNYDGYYDETISVEANNKFYLIHTYCPVSVIGEENIRKLQYRFQFSNDVVNKVKKQLISNYNLGDFQESTEQKASICEHLDKIVSILQNQKAVSDTSENRRPKHSKYTLEDMQEFLKDESILTRKELCKKYSISYSYASTLKYKFKKRIQENDEFWNELEET